MSTMIRMTVEANRVDVLSQKKAKSYRGAGGDMDERSRGFPGTDPWLWARKSSEHLTKYQGRVYNLPW